jgi:hypothetical protein
MVFRSMLYSFFISFLKKWYDECGIARAVKESDGLPLVCGPCVEAEESVMEGRAKALD